MSLSFTHDQLARRVLFHAGAIDQLGAEADRLGLKRLLLIGRPRYARRVQEILGSRVAAVIEDPVMHVPAAQAAEAGTRAAEASADGCIAVGGGSAIGLAKAVAKSQRHPVIAVPTTYSGSEMTQVWGTTVDGVKTTGRDPAIAPRTVVYDPRLTATLPADVAVPSAVNAMAHAVEALWSPDRNPMTDLVAAEGIRALVRALPGLADGRPEASGHALYGAWLCGICLDSTTMSLHHKLCHVLGGLGLPHAQTHTVVLPHVVAYNAGHAPEAASAIGTAVGSDHPATALQDLTRSLAAPSSLCELGMTEDAIARAVDLIMAAPYANPREVTPDGVQNLLWRAWAGATVAEV